MTKFLKQTRLAFTHESAVDCLNDFSELDREDREYFVDNYKDRIARLLKLANQDDNIKYYLDVEDVDFYTVDVK